VRQLITDARLYYDHKIQVQVHFEKDVYVEMF